MKDKFPDSTHHDQRKTKPHRIALKCRGYFEEDNIYLCLESKSGIKVSLKATFGDCLPMDAFFDKFSVD